MGKPLIVYDRSRVTTDWQCPRKRYLNYEYLGKGLVPNHTHLELYLGTAVHDGLAAIARGVPVDLLADTARLQVETGLTGDGLEAEFAKEQAALVEGMLRGFNRYAWPRLTTQYPKILWVEEEMLYHHDGLTFMARPDLVVEDAQGDIWYLEYKTTSSKQDGWINSWDTAVQLHSSIRAIEETKKVKVTGVIVQGLYKGYASYGKQNSPFCYCYKKAGNPPFSQDQHLYEYKPGFKRTPTWEMAAGVAGWVGQMPDALLADQFPQTPPIFVKDSMIDAFFAQRNVREREIEMATTLLEMIDQNPGDPSDKDAVLNTAFPQRFDQCNPGWGKPCAYRLLCHSHVDDPLQHGFTEREPHHALEASLP
jgi:hypothetical protein